MKLEQAHRVRRAFLHAHVNVAYQPQTHNNATGPVTIALSASMRISSTTTNMDALARTVSSHDMRASSSIARRIFAALQTAREASVRKWCDESALYDACDDVDDDDDDDDMTAAAETPPFMAVSVPSHSIVTTRNGLSDASYARASPLCMRQ
jgi:hypothetical protein